MSKFKVREAKTVSGDAAFIHEITEDKIFGKLEVAGVWRSANWTTDGRWYHTSAEESCFDLIPNNEPLRAEFEEVVKWAEVFGDKPESYTRHVVIVPDQFADKCVKVTLEVLE